jgi:subtilisin family serine protease/subtilisin-like proprotein convertase family protein
MIGRPPSQRRKPAFQESVQMRTAREIRNRNGKAHGQAGATGSGFETLEQRTMLSGGPGVESIEWRGYELEAVENSWIVTFDDLLGAQGAIDKTFAMLQKIGAVASSIEAIGRGGYAEFTTAAHLTEKVVDWAISAVEGVKAIEPNRVMSTMQFPNDPFLGQQWSHDNSGQLILGSPGTAGADISSIAAWDVTIGSGDVIIAVIDTGVDYTHPDLAGNMWTNPGEIAGNGIDDDGNGFVDDIHGWDFGEQDNDPQDDDPNGGHGTLCAGVIGAVGNNGIGIAGVAWNVKIMALKVINSQQGGFFSTAAIIGSHDYASMMIGRGVNLVASNNSYGAFGPGFYEDAPEGFVAEKDAIQRFVDTGATFVASAGNDGHDNDNPEFKAFPASYNIPGVITVAATDNNDGLANFSNWGAETVDLGAPGVSVYTTTYGGGYAYVNGTSFSGPTVAGAVALLKSVRPTASAIEVKQALINGVDPIPSLQGRVVSGGRLNVAESLRIIGLSGPTVKSIDPGPVDLLPKDAITVTFSQPLDPSFIDAGSVTLESSGGDGTFGDTNSAVEAIASVELSGDGLTVTITPAGSLSVDSYRLTLDPAGFRGLVGDYLNGDALGGVPEVYIFKLAGVGTNFENNDTLLSATPINFDASGEASFNGVTIGDGLFAALDVDLFKVQIDRGGLITAQVDAKNLPTPSSLDTYLRLFDAAGNELAANDQFNGSDSFLDYFVTTGGTYYIGVSGFPNSNYNPRIGGSGTTQSKGNYNLTVGVALVDDDERTYADTFSEGIDIPDQGFITDQIFVPDSRLILDVNISVNISHDFVGDLRVSLISPSGKEVVLMGSVGGDGTFQINDLSPVPALFDDEAAQSITLALPPYGGGSFRPQQALSGFDAGSGLGTWTLRVADQSAFNSGTLNGWSLRFVFQNNIFGPFELNDTLTTARDLGINGTGAAQRQASIGDGGFGDRDVDIFRFIAGAGSSLNAAVVSGGALNSAMRLFDGLGNELKVSNPEGINASAIVNFVFVNGGTYYIGISESTASSGDGAYDPGVAGSGADAVTTGSYTLAVELTSGVGDGSVLLNGQRISLGFSASGALDNGSTGISFLGNEMLRGDLFDEPTVAYFGAVASGNSFRNDGAGGDIDLPMSITSQSDAFNRRIVGQGEFRGLLVERAVSFSISDSFVVFDVSLTNTTGLAMSDVAWMEAINPQPGLNISPYTANTLNDVLDGSPFVSARYVNNAFLQGLTLALAAPQSETRAAATVLNPFTVIRDPQQVLDAGVIDPDGAAADGVLALSFDIGILQAGDTANLRYFMFLSDDPAEIAQQYADLNSGAGTGNLAVDAGQPADDADGLASLPYSLYYPEGFANGRSSTFIPILNPNETDSRVIVIARYEVGDRDQVLFDEVIPATTRSGITITTPELYAANTLLVRKDTPYAIEIRSQAPVAATMSHYDFGASIGEAFTSVAASTWSFSQVSKGQGSNDFVVFYNASDATVKVTTTLYREGGGAPIVLTSIVEAHRRSGWNLAAESAVPDGVYGVVVSSSRPVVASVSSYNESQANGFGALATQGIGSTGGALPQGQFGLTVGTETITILNANSAQATVTFTFSFDNGSSYRAQVDVAARSRGSLKVDTLPNFQVGRPYAVSYTATAPVSIATPTLATGESEGAAFSNAAWSYWGFAEGFRPAGQTDQVSEYLRLYNAEADDVVVEIKISFADGTSETFRRISGAGRVTEIDIHTLITGDRRLADQFYGVSVKASSPIVAYMGRTDEFFPGAFGSLGTPLGVDVDFT